MDTPQQVFVQLFNKLLFAYHTDDCILLKIYQGWLFKPANAPDLCYQGVHLKVQNRNGRRAFLKVSIFHTFQEI